VETTPGKRGEYTVWVNGKQVAQKNANGFPTEPEVLAAVKGAIA
jgi:hypothetical protein